VVQIADLRGIVKIKLLFREIKIYVYARHSKPGKQTIVAGAELATGQQNRSPPLQAFNRGPQSKIHFPKAIKPQRSRAKKAFSVGTKLSVAGWYTVIRPLGREMRQTQADIAVEGLFD
jgi:hypothetical protein